MSERLIGPVTVGRIVMVKSGRHGDFLTPAIVTAVHSESVINCRVFVDSEHNLPWLTSIPNEDDASAGYLGPTWQWPARVQGPMSDGS